MKIDQSQLERAMSELGFTQDQSALLWRKLDSTPGVESRFEPAHVGYSFGALLVIGAMGWFITEGWDRFAGGQLTAIALVYAGLFVTAGSRVWRKSMYQVPGGLLITMAVCMTPLGIYGIERQFHLWPQLDPRSFTHNPLINASWVGMEVGTVLAALVALRYFKFPFLTVPAAYALWYMSMDLTGLVFGKTWTFERHRHGNLHSRWTEPCRGSELCPTTDPCRLIDGNSRGKVQNVRGDSSAPLRSGTSRFTTIRELCR